MPAFQNFPSLGFFRQCRDDEGELKVMFDEMQLTLLKELHTAYWNGKRHFKDGELLLPGGSAPSAQPPGGSAPGTQHPGGSALGTQHPGGSAPSAQHPGSSSQQADMDPILGPSGLKFSTRMANLLEKEDERGLQLELLDEDEDISSISPPFLGLFQPFSHSLFQELDEDPMPANDEMFPWEFSCADTFLVANSISKDIANLHPSKFSAFRYTGEASSITSISRLSLESTVGSI